MSIEPSLNEGLVTISETNHTTTINIYKLNYATIVLTLGCVAVFVSVVSCSFKGKKKETLKLPAPIVYYLAKTANKPHHAELCITLIKNEKYDINYVHPEIKLSLFLCACLSGSCKLINFMVQRGAEICSKSFYGDSGLYLAVSRIEPQSKNFKALDILLSAGCGINSQNNDGFTALHLASSRGHMSLVSYLIENGSDPKIPTFNDVLAQALAVTNGHNETAEYLKNLVTKSTVV